MFHCANKVEFSFLLTLFTRLSNIKGTALCSYVNSVFLVIFLHVIKESGPVTVKVQRYLIPGCFAGDNPGYFPENL